MGWFIAGYVVMAVLTAIGWGINNSDRISYHRDNTFIIASAVLWPLHFLWTVIRGIPDVFKYERGPVKLTRREQRKVLLEDAINDRLVKRNAIEREYKTLTGTLPLE